MMRLQGLVVVMIAALAADLKAPDKRRTPCALSPTLQGRADINPLIGQSRRKVQ